MSNLAGKAPNLPSPSGRVHDTAQAWFDRRHGGALWAQPGHVFGRGLERYSLDDLEADALAVLAAVAWARAGAEAERPRTKACMVPACGCDGVDHP